jgi:sugar lactone lactonase YvrE
MFRSGLVSGQLLGRSAIALAFALGAASGVAGVSAQDGTPEAGGPPPIPANCVVVADGLLNPRHLALGEDGTLYISEAGNGGSEETATSETGRAEIGTPVTDNERLQNTANSATPASETDGDPVNPFLTSTRGDSGRISVVSPDGEQSVLSDGFISYSDGVGPEGLEISADGTTLYLAVGGTGLVSGEGVAPGENTFFTVDIATGEATAVVDLGAYEEANNPDGTDINPNLYGSGIGPDGQLYVIDTGANIVYTVDPDTGDFAPYVVFPTLDVIMRESGAPVSDEAIADAAGRQVVPTDIAFAADGTPIVSFLSGFWPEGAPSIVTVTADGTIAPYLTGVDGLVALTTGPDGALYAAQISGDLSTFAPGNVFRVGTDGTSEPVLENLVAPHGLIFDDEGGLYVITGALALDSEPNGQVLYCEGVAAPETAAAPVSAGFAATLPGAVRP